MTTEVAGSVSRLFLMAVWRDDREGDDAITSRTDVTEEEGREGGGGSSTGGGGEGGGEGGVGIGREGLFDDGEDDVCGED